MPLLPPLRLTGGQVLRDGRLQDDAITLANGLLCDDPAPEMDVSGYLVLPGLIDLHGDGFERHLTPRPAAPFDKRRALASAAAELAVNGITTAWFAQSWSWEGGFRSGAATCALLEALDDTRDQLPVDVRVQIRLETHVIDDHTQVREAVARHGVDFVVFNNHLPEAVEMAETKPQRFAQWAAQQGRAPEELMTIIRDAQEQESRVPAALATLAADFGRAGVVMGSHDDATAETRAFFRDIGARLCEFPTTHEAAAAARASGDPVVMGAPNVVRGGSQSGNIAATSLIGAGLCDGLVSDYYYPAMHQSVFSLSDAGLCTMADGWAMVSDQAARITGLNDRGRLEPGLRADVVLVNAQSRKVEMTISAGRVAHLSGRLAASLARS